MLHLGIQMCSLPAEHAEDEQEARNKRSLGGLGRLQPIQGLPSIKPHGMAGAFHCIHYSFLLFPQVSHGKAPVQLKVSLYKHD